MARRFNTSSGSADLIRLELEDHYAGLLEVGTAATLRSFRLQQLERELSTSDGGVHVHDRAALRQAVDDRSEEWMPRERIRATLQSRWVPSGESPDGHTVLTVIWFQDEDTDPFARLAEILRDLSWERSAAYEPADD